VCYSLQTDVERSMRAVLVALGDVLWNGLL